LILLSAATSGAYGQQAPKRLEIEKAMREFQVRPYAVKGTYVKWLPCVGCSLARAPAAPYPADRYYGEELAEAQQVRLVKALATKFWGVETKTYERFVEGNIDGAASINDVLYKD